jgi:long-chain fatty acid transport protein
VSAPFHEERHADAALPGFALAAAQPVVSAIAEDLVVAFAVVDPVTAIVAGQDVIGVRAFGEKLLGRARVEVGLDLNGRDGLETVDDLLAFDRAGDLVATRPNLSIDSARRVDTGVYASIDTALTSLLSLGAGVNAMYGMFDQRVAINNALPSLGDGRLEIDDDTWGWGGNVGVLYEPTPGTRLGLTYTSQIDLDFSGPAQFSGIGPILNALLQSRGLLDAPVDVGAIVPQQVMGSVYTEINDRWALMGNVGWQDWSEFGEVEIGIDNTQNPVSLANPLSFDDTWHVAMGAQYRPSDQWKVNVGLAYDSGFQDGNDVSPLFPVNSAWRLGAGGERQASESFKWGFTTALLYGGHIDVDKRSALPPLLGGRGNLVGGYDQTLSVLLTVYGNWAL